jgi:hypothetical protein
MRGRTGRASGRCCVALARRYALNAGLAAMLSGIDPLTDALVAP